MTQSMIDRTVSHYRILEKLGEGGMGVVYKALDTKLGRVAVLKFLRPDAVADPKKRKSFIDEALSASSFDHPNICTVYEIGESDTGELFIAMPYYNGLSLRSLIEKGRLSVEQTTNILIQLAVGLAKAHSLGIVHRDIKPGNLILTTDDTLKIIDFGLAQAVVPDRTLNEFVAGTFPYLSPEQAKGSAIDHCSDIWAVGVVAYEMLTTRSAFLKQTVAGTLHAILIEEPISISQLNPNVPFSLEAIIEKCLAKRKEARYQHMTELLADLRAFKEGHELAILALRYRVKRDADSDKIDHALPFLAVLPFENVGPDKEKDYLGDGLTDELINALGQLRAVRVVSRTSVFEFKGKAQNVRKIGEQLNVSYIVEGSVRQVRSHVRIVVRLVTAADGHMIWSHQFDRELKDIFDLQDELARTIASQLSVELDGSRILTEAVETGHEQAYELYLKGRFHWHKRNPAAIFKAMDYFEQAVAVTPKYAAAWAGLAESQLKLTLYGLAPSLESWNKTKSLALRAVELDKFSPHAHAVLGAVRMFYEWDWTEAQRELLTALELNPGFAQALHYMAYREMMMGHLDEAWTYSQQAHRLDPLAPDMYLLEAAILTYMGNYSAALDAAKKSYEIEPNSIELYYIFGLAYQGRGMMSEAVDAFEKGHNLSQDSPLMAGWLGACYAECGRRNDAFALLDGLLKRSQTGYVSPLSFATLYCGLCEFELSLDWLEKAAELRDGIFAYLKVIPTFAPLRSFPRYKALLQQMGLH